MESVLEVSRLTVPTWRKAAVAAELGAVLFAVLLQLWLWQGRTIAGTLFTYAFITIVAVGGWRSRRENLKTLGLVGVWPVFFMGSLLAAKLTVEHFHLFPHPGAALKAGFLFGGYFAWAFVQELLLNGFFAIRLQAFLGHRMLAAAAAGAVFSLCHAPNPLLVPLTFVWGSLASGIFLAMRRKNLYFLTLVHALAGCAIAACLPHIVPWLHPMAVGSRFGR